ncbi:dTDP-4-dehydrorhamnose 3,5-epimerase family protein [uncultured Pseudodesulfovibrio sp.]|uniref:dTDP-4-dehydrorhamnose 3,5-epimerase family protein n=1 Tax=uncultured Pseudodesulfovibrio sp. TaxID=2035858 RepID=UPI0029C82198|nr:dTDP-4-dehydrorhamnose 3,5-epimerase family protein [uncultured Pseudodesulfovibrio sp.]
MQTFKDTALEGVKLISLDPFEDHRGSYVELYNRAFYTENGLDVRFVEDDISTSERNVLRGIHGDTRTWKLISCLYGRFYLVVVNNDENSPQYRQWTSFTLSAENRLQVLVPPRFGNGHLVLSDKAIFHYKQSEYYNPEGQFTLKWDDPDLDIWWPMRNPVLSRRDEQGSW